jgi:predicted transcriptional regulator
MALCQTCFSDLTQDMAKGHVHREFIEESYLNHERLAVVTHQYYRQLMLRQPMEDAATKEPVGSLVPSYKVTQVANTYFFNRRPDMLDQEAHMITERILVHLATEALEDGKKKILANEAAGLHLTSQETPALIQGEGAENEESVSSPGIVLVSQDNSTRLKAMINAYDDAQEGYDAYKRAKKEMTLAHKLSFNRKQKKKHRKKLNGGEKVLRSITEEMGALDMGAYYQDDFAWLFKCEFDPKGKQS